MNVVSAVGAALTFCTAFNLAASFSDYSCWVRSDRCELVVHLGDTAQEVKATWAGWGESQDLRIPPVDHLGLGDLPRLNVKLFQNSTNFLWMVVPRARFTL